VTGDRGEEEAEIRRITLQSKPRQAVCENLSKKNNHKKRAGKVDQRVVPDFKPQ
jgi:hypothetical protein